MRSTVEHGYKNVIGPSVKKIRITQGITQRELADKLEGLGIYLDRSSISKIERQNRTVTDYELVALARVLQMEVEWFFM